MFNKTDDPQDAAGPSQAHPTRATNSGGKADQSQISAGLKVVGNLESDGDVVISGVVEGDIASRGLTIAQGATVQGSIQADNVQIMGSVQGQVRARTVKIARTGEMTGDVNYESLSIEEGAMLDGQCRRIQSGRAAGDAKVSKLTAVEGGAKKEEAKPSGTGGSKAV
ncbi:MAG TPA: polymer-forming cytoskeletal protein [Alphaproteobacteria bacterium]